MLCIRVFGRGVSGERDDAYVVEYGTKSRTFECDFRESLVRRNSSNVQVGEDRTWRRFVDAAEPRLHQRKLRRVLNAGLPHTVRYE